jgi:hypothetical protein
MQKPKEGRERERYFGSGWKTNPTEWFRGYFPGTGENEPGMLVGRIELGICVEGASTTEAAAGLSDREKAKL